MTDLPCTVTSQELDHYEEHQQAGCATCERAVAYLNEIAEPDAIITL